MGSPLSFEGNGPASLDATSNPPAMFDGTTRLYMSYVSPYAQRAWITRNYKGLQEKIELVPINLFNKPSWYKERVNPASMVPALEHNGKVITESLDVIKYIDGNFDGPSLYPKDPEKRELGEYLMKYSNTTFINIVIGSFRGNPAKESTPVFDHLENVLHKFNEGPFFLGKLSLVDIAFITVIERVQPLLEDAFKYDITLGRPKLATWIKEMNKIDAYSQTKVNRQQVIKYMKSRYMLRASKSILYQNQVSKL
ncbi:glutathione S-transferase L1-like [Raphanus sativus]|uniref:Glutathione S-transferase L1-like n=1 Tax=Raphanus sativus TaxID=3726 RepID=A0A9W3D946_RAPSA|nr:glutathione S-transferase L1-like [Raphanus sativus]